MEKVNYNNIKHNIKIIDVRNKYEYDMNHLPNSINIPYDNLISYHKKFLNKNEMYYVTCKHGNLSKRAASILNSLGYNIIVLEK